MKKCVLYFLSWCFVVFLVLLAGGLISIEVKQSTEFMKWLLFRRWYPYFQAVSFSIFFTSLVLVLTGFVEIDRMKNIALQWQVLGKIGKALNTSCPQQKNIFPVILAFSFIFVVLSLSFPQCIKPTQILVSFDVRDDGKLIADVFEGETVSIEAGRHINIDPKFETNISNLPTSQITCQWTYTGDGRINSSSHCKTDYQSGVDEMLDTVSVGLSQPFCPSLGFYTFIFRKLP